MSCGKPLCYNKIEWLISLTLRGGNAPADAHFTPSTLLEKEGTIGEQIAQAAASYEYHRTNCPDCIRAPDVLSPAAQLS